MKLWRLFWIAAAILIGYMGYQDFENRPKVSYPEGATAEEREYIDRMFSYLSIKSSISDAAEEWDGRRLVITYNPKSVWSGASWVEGFLSTARQVFETARQDQHGLYQQIVFDVKMPVVGPDEQKTSARGMLIGYDWSSLSSAKLSLNNEVAESFSKLSVGRLGRESIQEFCDKQGQVNETPRFCMEALAR